MKVVVTFSADSRAKIREFDADELNITADTSPGEVVSVAIRSFNEMNGMNISPEGYTADYDPEADIWLVRPSVKLGEI